VIESLFDNIKRKGVVMSRVSMIGCLLAGLICGCASNQVSLVEKKQLIVEKQCSDKVDILWTDVYQQEGQAWAYGVLEQQDFGTGIVKAHVDIQVVAPDGTVSYKTASDDVYVPCKRIGKGIHWKRFKSQLPEMLTAGSQITMTVHSDNHKKPEAKS
jgi:hypothetical protein